MSRRRRFRLVALATLAASGVWLVRSAGTALLVADTAEPAQAAVVFGGQVPFRAMEAAVFYREGLAREVWVTQGAPSDEDMALAELGIEKPPDHGYSVRTLERSGVPDGAIRVLAAQADNTADEVRIIAREARLSRAERLILITSKYHTRRVRVLWNSLVGDHPAAVVRYAPRDPFDPEHWWRNSRDALAVTREWFGLLNAWAGFPVTSRR